MSTRLVGSLLALAGLFALVPLASGASQLKPGSLDPSFGPRGIVTARIRAYWPATGPSPIPTTSANLKIQADRKIVIAGFVKRTHGSRDDFALSRYLPNGKRDLSFGRRGTVRTAIGDSAAAQSVLVQPNRRLLAVGLTTVGGEPVLALARYMPTGARDRGFGRNGIVTTNITAITGYSIEADGLVTNVVSAGLQAHGSIVVSFGVFNDTSNGFGLVRYKPDGSLDQSFGSHGMVLTLNPLPGDCSSSESRALVIQPDGKIITGGWTWETCDGGPAPSSLELIRYEPNGSLDQSFGYRGVAGAMGTGDAEPAVALALQRDGKILVAGTSYYQFALARLDADGAPDRSFEQRGFLTPFVRDSTAAAVAVQPNGRIVVAGSTEDAGSGHGLRLALVRYLGNGSMDRSFGGRGKVVTSIGGEVGATAVALQRSGKIIVGATSAKRAFVLLRYLGKR